MKVYITPITLIVCALAIIIQQRVQSLALMQDLSAVQAAVEAFTKGYKPPLQQIIADGVTQSHDDLEQRARDKELREWEALKTIRAEARIPAHVTDPEMRRRAAEALVKIEDGK